MRQSEGRRLGVVAEQALAAPKYDGTSHEPKFVHQPGWEQLAHQIAATLRQEIAAVPVLERAYRVGKVALQRMTVLPGKRIGSVRGHVLGHAVEQVSDGVARIGPDARPKRREYVVGATPQQQLERLREQVLLGLADGLVVVGRCPSTEPESVSGIFLRRTRGLNNAIQTDESGNDELAHSLHRFRPHESSRKGMLTAITQLHSPTDSRPRLCDIDTEMPE